MGQPGGEVLLNLGKGLLRAGVKSAIRQSAHLHIFEEFYGLWIGNMDNG